MKCCFYLTLIFCLLLKFRGPVIKYLVIFSCSETELYKNHWNVDTCWVNPVPAVAGFCSLHWAAFKPFERQREEKTLGADNANVLFWKYLITICPVCILKFALLCVSEHLCSGCQERRGAEPAGLRHGAGNGESGQPGAGPCEPWRWSWIYSLSAVLCKTSYSALWPSC